MCAFNQKSCKFRGICDFMRKKEKKAKPFNGNYGDEVAQDETEFGGRLPLEDKT